MGQSTTGQFHSFPSSLHPYSHPFYVCMWPSTSSNIKSKDTQTLKHPRRDTHWWCRLLGWLEAGCCAWLQLPHMTSPFIPHHSLQLPSPGHTIDKECLECVCLCVWVCLCKNVSTLPSNISCLFKHCVVEVCAPWAILDKMAVQRLRPGTQGHKFTVCLLCHLLANSSPLPCFLSSAALTHSSYVVFNPPSA